MRGSSIQLAGSTLPCPGHVCAFFSSKAEEDAAYLPFMAEGIAAGDKCVHSDVDIAHPSIRDHGQHSAGESFLRAARRPPAGNSQQQASG
jgi:hypothetical protein